MTDEDNVYDSKTFQAQNEQYSITRIDSFYQLYMHRI